MPKPSNAQPTSLSDVVENGLCIGCGLCQALAGDAAIEFGMTPEGRERPRERRPLAPEDWAAIAKACPGVRIEGQDAALLSPAARCDPVWGPYLRICRGYASDPTVRFAAATGGVLTALAAYMVESGRADFALHLKASPDQPMRSVATLSRTPEAVIEASGSRYGPAAPLKVLAEALSLEKAFVFVGKPCDVGALRLLARSDPRVGKFCKAMLTLVCGGASEFGKSLDVIHEYDVTESEVRSFRYRGYGNPGRTRIETEDGRAFEKTYLEMWADESKWRLQNRCKICPDAIGEVADIAAADAWPGGAPSGEDAGFNAIVVRTECGQELLEAAVRDGALVVDREWTTEHLDDFQPHQVRKKLAVWARYQGMRTAGKPVPEVVGLRIEDLARRNGLARNLKEARGAKRRADEGRMSEPAVRFDRD